MNMRTKYAQTARARPDQDQPTAMTPAAAATGISQKGIDEESKQVDHFADRAGDSATMGFGTSSLYRRRCQAAAMARSRYCQAGHRRLTTVPGWRWRSARGDDAGREGVVGEQRVAGGVAVKVA